MLLFNQWNHIYDYPQWQPTEPNRRPCSFPGTDTMAVSISNPFGNHTTNAYHLSPPFASFPYRTSHFPPGLYPTISTLPTVNLPIQQQTHPPASLLLCGVLIQPRLCNPTLSLTHGFLSTIYKNACSKYKKLSETFPREPDWSSGWELIQLCKAQSCIRYHFSLLSAL